MKRIWTVLIPGYRPFSMVLMDGPQDMAGALREARLIWPNCEVEP
ncbi:hypothetical protein [Pseudomonas parafulva]|nr:hypothetical protein [Pseudomonas parafulva]